LKKAKIYKLRYCLLRAQEKITKRFFPTRRKNLPIFISIFSTSK
jgi:hypothetical protein